MSSFDRKRKREESDGGSSVREIKPEPAFIDLGESDNGNGNAIQNITETPRLDQHIREVIGVAPANAPRPRQDNKEDVGMGADRTTRQIDLDSFSVVAENNREMMENMMDLPEKLREDLAVKTASIQSDVTTNMVTFTKDFSDKIDGFKGDVKNKIDGYSRGVKELEKKLENKTDAIESSVKELDKKVEKKIKAAKNEANKDRGTNVKVEVKKEVNECLRGFGALLNDFLSTNDAAAGPLPAGAAAAAPASGVFGPPAPATGAHALAGPSPAAPLVPANFGAGEPVPLLPRNLFMQWSILTNKGYHTLMSTIKFTYVNHLAQLVKLDNYDIARKCIIFTDMKFNTYTIDYVLQSGFAVRQLGAGSGCASARGHEQANLLYHSDLNQLRLLKMKMDPRAMLQSEQSNYQEWERRWKPPTYVYDLGELVLRKRSTRLPYLLFVSSTPYNLLLEVSRTNKRVWIVMSPQHELTRKAANSVKDSNCAFNGLEYGRIALVAQNISEIQFDRSEFLPSAASFEAAHHLILDSLCPGVPSVDFSRAVNIKQMCSDLA